LTDIIAADLEELGSIEQRFAGTAAERRALEAVRARLVDVAPGRVEGLVGHPMPLLVLGLHGVLLFGSGMLGMMFPKVGVLACLAVSISLIGEGTGRFGALRAWLPRVPSYNLVVPPKEEGSTLGTVILATPLDVPRWRPPRLRWPRRPLMGVLVSAGLLCALLLMLIIEPWNHVLAGLYAGALVVTAITATGVVLSRREPRRVEADASGLAVTLELVRRLRARPLPGVATWTVFTGCGRAHQDGIASFLRLRGERLRRPVLVVAVVEPGRPSLSAVLTEGPLWPQHHRPTGPALIERMRWAGVRIPEVDRTEPTDARAAMILGFRGLALAGGDGASTPESCVRAADVVETVLRWYRDDLARVEGDRVTVAALVDPTETAAL
jgi:hypothetical protein